MAIYKTLTDIIGKTPMLELEKYCEINSLGAKIIAKLEYFNPAGSVKDRVAVSMIEDAEKRGLLTTGSVIIEPTSGNTGIGLAAVAAARGYRCILTMPETMSIERRNLLRAYGAEIVLTSGSEGMHGAIAKATELAEEIEGAFIPGQFTNPANPDVHYRTTGPEIWEDMGDKLDIFVAGVGTGGTVSGVGQFLKSKKPNIQIHAIEPFESPVISGGNHGPHRIQGIGAGFIPEILDTYIYDSVIKVRGDDAISTVKELIRTQGLLVGISSGAAVWASSLLARLPENKGKTIVTLLADSGERYLSVPGFIE